MPGPVPRSPCAIADPAGREMTCPARIECSQYAVPSRARWGLGQSSRMPSPSSTTKISSSAEWMCGGAALPRRRRGGPSSALSSSPPAARASRRHLPPAAPSTSSRLMNIRRPLAKLGHVGLARADLAFPGTLAPADVGPTCRQSRRRRLAGDGRSRCARGCRRRARRGRRHRLGGSATPAGGARCSRRAGPRRRRRPGGTHPGREDVEDLLLAGVPVIGRRPLAWVDPIRFTPTVFVPAATPRLLHTAPSDRPPRRPCRHRPSGRSPADYVSCQRRAKTLDHLLSFLSSGFPRRLGGLEQAA